jgi:hypothetical protein
MVDGYVKVNGPLVLGQTEAGGLISYGPVQQISAQVTDMADLVEHVSEVRPDLLRLFKLESVAAFASAAGYTDPFGGEGLLAGIKVKTRVTRGLIVEGEQDEDESELEAPEE